MPTTLNSDEVTRRPINQEKSMEINKKPISILLSSKIHLRLNREDSFVFLLISVTSTSAIHKLHWKLAGRPGPRPFLLQIQEAWPPVSSCFSSRFPGPHQFSLRPRWPDPPFPSSLRDPSIRISKFSQAQSRFHLSLAKAKILFETVTVVSPFPLSGAGTRPPSGPSHFSQTKLPGNFLPRSPARPRLPSPRPGGR